MMLSDYKISCCDHHYLFPLIRSHRAPVGCIYLDTFLLDNFPDPPLFLSSLVAQRSYCVQVVPQSFPLHAPSSQMGRALYLVLCLYKLSVSISFMLLHIHVAYSILCCLGPYGWVM